MSWYKGAGGGSSRSERKFCDVLAGYPDLTARAAAGELPPTFGRDALVAEVLAALVAGQTALTYGPSGTGKSAVWYEVARRIARGAVPAPLAGLAIFQTSVAQLQQGCIYAGYWEEKLAEVVGEFAELAHTGTRAVLLIADFGNLFRVSRSSRNDEKVIADDVLQYVQSGQLLVAGEVTPELYRPGLADDPRWRGRMRLVPVPPLAGPDLTAALRRLAVRRAPALAGDTGAGRSAWRAGKPGTATAEMALARAVELSDRFVAGAVQPRAALRLIERAAEAGRHDAAGIEAAASDETGVPLALISDAVPLQHAAIVGTLEGRVIGQAEAVGAIADAIALTKAGLTDPRRPLGVFLFTGPSGTGKTELAKGTAAYLFGDESALVRLDMSEYFGGESAGRLAATLVARLTDRPMSVVLLDEVEKADIGALDVLLQVCSDGHVTYLGRRVSLRQALIVMTANVGFGTPRPRPTETMGSPLGRGVAAIGFATERTAPGIGAKPITAAEGTEPDVQATLAARFRPEFLGRIDRVVVFQPLSAEAVRRIVRRELDRALGAEGFARRDILLEYDPTVVDLLAAEGTDARYGARPLVQAIRRQVVVPLARWLAANPGTRDALIWLTAVGGEVGIRHETLGD